MDERDFKEALNECLVEKYFEEISRLRETITGLEGRPMGIVYEEHYDKWLGSINDRKWTSKIELRENAIREFGRFGNSSHKCRSKEKIYEIVIDKTTLRIYFTVVDDNTIRFEDGSSSKEGSGHGSKQERVIDAIEKRVRLRNSKK